MLSGDDYLIFTHINISSPFKRWSEPAEWGRLNRSPTLSEIHAAFQPTEREHGSSGWPAGMQDPDLIIDICKSGHGHGDWRMPLDMEMDNYSSKEVRPGYADDGFVYLKAVESTISHSQDLRLAVMSLSESIAKFK